MLSNIFCVWWYWGVNCFINCYKNDGRDHVSFTNDLNMCLTLVQYAFNISSLAFYNFSLFYIIWHLQSQTHQWFRAYISPFRLCTPNFKHVSLKVSSGGHKHSSNTNNLFIQAKIFWPIDFTRRSPRCRCLVQTLEMDLNLASQILSSTSELCVTAYPAF